MADIPDERYPDRSSGTRSGSRWFKDESTRSRDVMIAFHSPLVHILRRGGVIRPHHRLLRRASRAACTAERQASGSSAPSCELIFGAEEAERRFILNQRRIPGL